MDLKFVVKLNTEKLQILILGSSTFSYEIGSLKGSKNAGQIEQPKVQIELPCMRKLRRNKENTLFNQEMP